MFDKILIANRGEIACRIIKTCERLNIQTVAIYSTIDAQSLHVKLATQAYCIGPPQACESYLHIDKIISCARQFQVQAIHPGYGFLSENAQFAKACEAAGIIFIGPHSQVIANMGNKAKAKILMQQAGLPVIKSVEYPNYNKQALDNLGLPLIIKAALGGGGKGMCIVYQLCELPDAIDRVQRESLKHFGSDKIIIEQYIPFARHIEVQIFGDHFNNTVHLFERDCSLQRRHQKIIEETPAQHIPQKTKQALYQAALKAVRALHYTNAGTVEFLYNPQTNLFYFLEINTRLQVEHAITEMTTGIDLVEWQLLVANHQALPLSQDQITQRHHAIEARIYAEDPHKNFLPATGTILKLIEPQECASVRIESGIQTGDHIDMYYDPMISKIVVKGNTRAQAIDKLKKTLHQYAAIGLTTNVRLLTHLLMHPDFISGSIYTQYLNANSNQNLNMLLQSMMHASLAETEYFLGPAILHFILEQKHTFYPAHCLWSQANAFQLNGPYLQNLTLTHRTKKYQFSIEHAFDAFGNYYHVTGFPFENPILIREDANFHKIIIAWDDPHTTLYLFQNGQTESYQADTKLQYSEPSFTVSKEPVPVAPMSGIITHLFIKIGDPVNQGDKLIAIEAMKMEHTLCAHQAGIITAIHYHIGDQVQEGCTLFEFEVKTPA